MSLGNYMSNDEIHKQRLRTQSVKVENGLVAIGREVRCVSIYTMKFKSYEKMKR